MTTFQFTSEEWSALAALPDDDVVRLATHLDFAPPEEIDARQLLEQCMPKLVDELEKNGIPLTKYDHDDLTAFDERQRRALAHLLRLRGTPSVRTLVRAGTRVTRSYQKKMLNDAIPYMVPLLLTPVVRLTLQRLESRPN